MAGFREYLAVVYGEQTASASTDLLSTLNQSRNRVKAESFGIDLSTTYHATVLQHLQLVNLVATKLDYPCDHYRHLSFKVGWLNTFSNEIELEEGFQLERDSCRYNLLIVGLYVLREEVRRSKNQQAIDRSRRLRYHLQQITEDHCSADLCKPNLDILWQLLSAYEWFCLAKEREAQYSINRKLLPKDIADAHWKAAHHFERARTCIERLCKYMPKCSAQFYQKHLAYYEVLSKLSHCRMIIRHLELYVSDEPGLFRDMLGYSNVASTILRQLQVNAYSQDELRVLQSFSNEVFETDEKLRQRNSIVYKTTYTPEAMLPISQIANGLVTIPPDTDFPSKEPVSKMLEIFWSEQVDCFAYELCRIAGKAVKEIQESLAEVKNNLNTACLNGTTKHDAKQLKTLISKAKQFLESPDKLTKDHDDCERRLKELKSKLNRLPVSAKTEKTWKWLSSTEEKMLQASKANSKHSPKLNEVSVRVASILKATEQFSCCPSLGTLQQRLQLLEDKRNLATDMVVYSYGKKIAERSKFHSIAVVALRMKSTIEEGRLSWLKEIDKLRKDVACITSFNRLLKDEQLQDLLEFIQRQKHGMEFYQRLIPEIERALDSLAQIERIPS